MCIEIFQVRNDGDIEQDVEEGPDSGYTWKDLLTDFMLAWREEK